MAAVTLSHRVQELLDEWSYWLRGPPADLPDFAKQMFSAAQMTKRASNAEDCRRELADAAALLRKHGFTGE